MSQKTLNLCLERYNFVKFGETTKSTHTVLCTNNAHSVNSDKYRLTPTAIASKHGEGYVFTLNYDFDRPLFTIVQKSYSIDGTSGKIVFEGIDPISKGGSKYLRRVEVSPVKLSDGSYLLEVTNDEYLRIGTTGAALGDEGLESLNEKIVTMGGIEKSVETVGGKQVLKLDASGSGGAKEIVYFDVDPSDPQTGLYTAIGEALSGNKLPAIKIDGAVYLYTATGTDKYVFVGGFTKESVGYTEIEVSDDDSVTSKSVDDKVFNMYMLYRTDPASPGDPPGTEDYWICDENKHVITKAELLAAHADCRYFILNNDIEPDSNSRKYFASVTVISNSYIRLQFYMMEQSDVSVADFFQKTVSEDSEGRLYISSSYSATLAGTIQAVLVSEPQNFDSTQKAQGRDNIGAASASDVAALQSQVSSLSDVSAYSAKGEATVSQLNAGPSGIQAGWAYQLTDSGTLTDGSLAVVAGDTVAWDGTKWFPLVKSDYYATKTYAQNVAHSIAPEYDPTRDEDHKYLAGECVVHEGIAYMFLIDHYGPWNGSSSVVKIVNSVEQLSNNRVVSSNYLINDIILEAYVSQSANLPSCYLIEIQKAVPYNANYRSLIRLQYGVNQFIYLYYKVSTTEEESLADLSAIVTRNNDNYALVNWEKIPKNTGKTFYAKFNPNISDVNYSPSIKAYLSENNLLSNIDSIKSKLSPVSNNDSVNDFIKELYISSNYVPITIEINKAYHRTSDYRNMIRFYDANGVQKHPLYAGGFLSENDALKNLQSYNFDDDIYIVVDWSKFPTSQATSFFNLVFPNAHNLDFSPNIAAYYKLPYPYNTEVSEGCENCDGVTSEATINTSGTYPLALPVSDPQKVEIFVDGLKKIYGVDYEVNPKNMFVKFNSLTPSQINFHYPCNFKKMSRSEALNDFGLEDGETISNPYAYKHYVVQTGKFGMGEYQWAEMVNDPEDSSKKVLCFVAKGRSDDEENARVQISQRDIPGYYEIESSVDMYFPSSYGWELLQDYEAHQFNFMTVNEQWGPLDNNLASNPAYRASLNIKNADDNHLYFHLNCQDKILVNGVPTWFSYNRGQGYNLGFDDSVNKKFPIPLDKWFTLKVRTKAGYHGHYRLEAVVDGVPTIIYDGEIMGMSPHILNEEYWDVPNGVRFISPALLKMYFGDGTMQYLVNNNTELRLLWRNLSYSAKDATTN